MGDIKDDPATAKLAEERKKAQEAMETPAELSNTRVFNYDHFLMVESDPQIEGRIQMFADESIGKLHELVN